MLNDWYIWATPVAVLAIVSMFCFTGCKFTAPTAEVTVGPYADEVASDVPVMYLRLQERAPGTTVPGGTAVDQMGGHNGVYERGPALQDIPQFLSPAASPPLIEIGVTPSLLATDDTTTALRVSAARVRVPFSPALNPPGFTLEALVQPEWDLSQQGRYYTVLESSDEPALGSTNSKRLGYAIYAGPADPTTPNTPYRWQLWVGDGNGFRQLKEQPPANPANPGPLVAAEPTYVAATFDGTDFVLWAYSAGRDMDFVKYSLVPQPYSPNTNLNSDLVIGIALARRGLVPPFPGPELPLYPFTGKLQEVAVHNTGLAETRIMSHIMSAFTE